MQRTFSAISLATLGLTLACGASKDPPADPPEEPTTHAEGEGEDDDSQAPATDPWSATEAGVFVHLFEWPWPDIATECESVLGPAGYAGVQVSPPNEHAMIAGRPWWERYQPVSYTLESRSGNEEEFVDMVQRCAAVGVGIYVDAVINHMSAQGGGTGSAGTTYTKYNFPGTWGPEDFHSPPCDIEPGDYVSDGSAVQQCELVGLADLDTSSDSVQQGLANYLLSLIDLGVAGFRIDAAKHTAPDDLEGILAKVSAQTDKEPFIFLEVIEGAGEAIVSADYLDLTIGSAPVAITEFRALRVGESFRSPSQLDALTDFANGAWDLLPSNRAVVFADNHDTQRNGSISFHDGVDHQLANIFLLASSYGYPKLMSSYAFTPGTGISDGPPRDGDGIPLGPHNPSGKACIITGSAPFDAETTRQLESGRWVCEHRDPQMVAMVGFRKATAGAPVDEVWTQGDTHVAFAREGKGFVLINHADEALSVTLPTGLPPGDYCNVLEATPEECETAQMITVSDAGDADFNLEPHRAAAFHVQE